MTPTQIIYTVSNGEHADLYTGSPYDVTKVVDCLESDQSLVIKTYQLNEENYGVTERGQKISEYTHQDDMYLVIFEGNNVRFVYDEEFYAVHKEETND